jgi:hypothetical protein
VRAAALLDRARRAGAWLTAARWRTAAAWGATTLALLLALDGAPGISRDEAAVLEASDGALRASGAVAAPAPPLAPAVAAAARVVLAPLGVSGLRAARVPSAVAGAALSVLLAAAAFGPPGPAAALLAPALFWAAPRHLNAGLVATPDLALAALALGLALAWLRAIADRERKGRVPAAIVAGILLGAALALRPDAWVLAAVLAVHAALCHAIRPRAAPEGQRLAPGSRTFLLVAAVAAAVLVALWPALLWSPEARGAALAAAGGRAATSGAPGDLGARPLFPLVAFALTVPVALLVVFAGGLAHAAARIRRGAGRDLAPRPRWPEELLVVLLALAPLAAAAAGLGPAGGVRAWLPAMPFLALLGARGLMRAAEVAWPTRAGPLVASLALFALWPAVRATAHAFPSGASAWNELAGGAPGAATLRLPRQDGGEAALRLVDLVNARAREGARVWWPTSSPAAIRALARAGRLRADLAAADGPDDADVAVVTLDGGGRDAEYRVWAAFRTARPVAGAYLDEVPLALAYARPGVWR